MNQRVVVTVDDLFFASKIRATAEHFGIDVHFARDAEAIIETARREKPAVIIIDLHSQKCDPFVLAERLKNDEELRHTPLVGFFSHVHTALAQRAEQAGFDSVMPRSAFTKNLPEILQAKGLSNAE